MPEYPLLAIGIWFASAVWLVTWPEPRTLAGPHPLWKKARQLLRLLGLVPAGAAALAVASEVGPMTSHSDYARPAVESTALFPVFAALFVVYVARLTSRMPRSAATLFFRVATPVVFVASPLMYLTWLSHAYREDHLPGLYPDAVAGLVVLSCHPILSVPTAFLCLSLLGMARDLWRLRRRAGQGIPVR